MKVTNYLYLSVFLMFSQPQIPLFQPKTQTTQRPTAANKADMIFVEGGTYTMGCTGEQQDCAPDEYPAHPVTIGDFYISRYEVSQRLWREVIGTNPSTFKNGDDCPVETITWQEVQVFLQKLNERNRHLPDSNLLYRLPTEAEWEYAARGGGLAVMFGNGQNTADPKQLNFQGSWAVKLYSKAGIDRQKTVAVGSVGLPNALGLYDMSGNVWEWCADYYNADYYKQSPATNPKGPTVGLLRVRRGGSWSTPAQRCRTAHRGSGPPGVRYSFVGLRLAASHR
jgi:formylglycine-generating enzyme